jgi:hypothetical protein
MIKRLLTLRLLLLAITTVILGWFAIQALCEGWKYIRLDTQAPAQVLKWEVKMLSSSHYALFATYRYAVSGQEFIGQTLFSTPCYLNHYAAENDIKERQAKEIHVWYQKKYPAFSALQKRFPKKELTNTVLTFGVLIYFYLIRGLVSRDLREQESL